MVSRKPTKRSRRHPATRLSGGQGPEHIVRFITTAGFSHHKTESSAYCYHFAKQTRVGKQHKESGEKFALIDVVNGLFVAILKKKKIRPDLEVTPEISMAPKGVHQKCIGDPWGTSESERVLRLPQNHLQVDLGLPQRCLSEFVGVTKELSRLS